MAERDELKDTPSKVAEDPAQPGFGVFRNPDGTRMHSPESVNTTRDSEKTEAKKGSEKKSA